MENSTLIIFTIIAFLFGFFAAALYIRWLISLNRRSEDRDDLPEENYPDVRRALYYIRMELFGLLGAVILVAGFLAAIVVVLIVRR